jgi:hypothetical protein
MVMRIEALSAEIRPTVVGHRSIENEAQSIPLSKPKSKILESQEFHNEPDLIVAPS